MKFWIFLMTIGMVACNSPSSVSIKQDSNQKQKLANEVRKLAARKLEQEVNLHPAGTIGQMLNKIQVLGLSFNYSQPVDILEGRKLLIKAVETMLHEINQQPRIHPYLIQYPFEPDNIEIAVFLKKANNFNFPHNSLSTLKAQDGILSYKINSPDGYQLITVYKETYQEALDRIADPTLPLASFEPDRELGSEELARLRKNIRYLSDDGSIYYLGENGGWIKATKL